MNIRVVREAGGIGDIVRIIPVLRGLREKYPAARLWVFAPATYRPLLRGWYDEYVATPHHGRRNRDAALDENRWPYLNVGVAFDRSISLYCPAFTYEVRQGRDVRLDRIDLFCQAAGVQPSSKLPVVNLHPADVRAAKEYVIEHELWERGKLIAVQPYSTDPARNWPLANWLRLAAALERAGHRVVILDGAEGRTRPFRQHRVIGRPLGFVAALLSLCDLLVGPDSGLGHLAAAVNTPCVGVFASQSGEIMYRHYPLHTYVEPSRDTPASCEWPCFWKRPARCTRAALLKAGKTCEMIGRISVGEVFGAVNHRCSDRTMLRSRISDPAHRGGRRRGG